MVLPFRVFAAFVIAAPLLWSGSAEAQSWRQEDPSAIVLPSQPDGSGARSGGNRGGIFRIFRLIRSAKPGASLCLKSRWRRLSIYRRPRTLMPSRW
jgi:hypothetical protein